MPAFIQDLFDLTKSFLFENWYFFLPILLILVFWDLWLHYIRTNFLLNLKWTTLKIKLPKEIMKSPQAMEVFLNTLYQTKDGNLIEKYLNGWLRPWFSLEIVGIGGEIHFFIYTQSFFRNLIEAQIYAQYPEVEIVEVEDYSKAAFTDGFDTEWGCWGSEFALTKEDAYPIKTYIDYGLHQLMTKEEQKTDPINSLLELLGALKEGEQIWLQILIRATKKEWKDAAKKLVDQLMKRDKKPKEGEVVQMGSLMLSPGERTVVEAIERDVAKLGFDVGIRALYLARNDRFNAVNIASIIGSLRQYNSVNLNGFKPARSTSIDYFFKKTRETILKKKMLKLYRKRSYFYIPYDYGLDYGILSGGRPSFVLNTEELATIFHFPGRVAETPTFGRIEAKKGEPPSGLPV